MYRSGKSVFIATVALLLVAAGLLYWLTRADDMPGRAETASRVHGRWQAETARGLSPVGLRWHAVDTQRAQRWQSPIS